MVQVIDPRVGNSVFKSSNIRAVEAVPNFLSITREGLSEKVNQLLDELSELGVPPQGRHLVFSEEDRLNQISVKTHLKFNGQPVEMSMQYYRFYHPGYRLYLVMSDVFNLKGIFRIESLPIDPDSVGFTYDLSNNSVAKQSLSDLADRRISAKRYAMYPQSIILGTKYKEGLEITLRLHLQDENLEKYLNVLRWKYLMRIEKHLVQICLI